MSDTVNKINSILGKLKLYLEANYLHINIKKSKFMHFKTPRGQKNPCSSSKILFGKHCLEQVSTIKFLGIKINERLSWKDHVKFVTNKVRTSISQLYNMRKVIPKSMKNSVYNALVNSQLSYGISVWGGMRDGDILKPLFVLQKRALRTLFGIQKVSKYIKGHTKQVFHEKKILVVYNIYNYMTILDTAKLLAHNHPTVLCKLLNITSDNVGSLRNFRMSLPSFKLNRYQNTFSYQGPKLWNSLASSNVLFKGVSKLPAKIPVSFIKTRLKKFLLEMQKFGVDESDNNWQPYNWIIDSFITLKPY